MLAPAGHESDFWKLVAGTALTGQISFSGQIPSLQAEGEALASGEEGFHLQDLLQLPEVTDGVISLFNGPELIPLKHFCCCQEFIWLCWSHFHEEQRKAGLGSNVDWITVHCSRGWRYLIHNPHFSSPHCTSTTWKKNQPICARFRLVEVLSKYSHCRTEINDILCLSNKHLFCHKAFVAFK